MITNVQSSYKNLKRYHIDRKFKQELQSLKDQLEKLSNNANNNINNSLKRSSQQEKLKIKSQETLKLKQQEVKSKNINIQAFSGAMKQCVSKIRPEVLAKIQVQEESVQVNALKLLFSVIYQEPEDYFTWEFIKQILKKNGEDFKARMAVLNLRGGFSSKDETSLLKLKNLQQFEDKAVQNNQLIEILDWVDFTLGGIKLWHEKQTLQTQLNKIKRRVALSSMMELTDKPEFWTEISNITKDLDDSLQQVLTNMNGLQISVKKAFA